MHMAFLSRVFKNLQWYGMTTKKDAFWRPFLLVDRGTHSFLQIKHSLP